ncbi:MAG: hypothetical protein ACLGJB_05800 [Blastocatellia bacterium]
MRWARGGLQCRSDAPPDFYRLSAFASGVIQPSRFLVVESFYVKKFALLIKASALSQLRWARQHIYSWLVLAPLVLGLTYFTVVRVAGNIPPWRPSPWLAGALGALFVAALVGMSLSRASAELYHLRRPEGYFDALPIDADTHLLAALAGRFGRTAVVAIAFLLARHLLAETRSVSAANVVTLIFFSALTALAEVFGSLNWIHWGHTRQRGAACVAVVVLVPTVLTCGALLALLADQNYLPATTKPWLAVACAAWACGLYLLAGRSHRRWRVCDIEYARRLESPSRWNVFGAQLIRKKFSPAVAAQLARDLQLTLRAFSSAVYVVLLIMALWVVALVIVLLEDLFPFAANFSIAGWLDLSWLPQSLAIKFACVLAAASLASLLPLLVAYELPLLWVERAIGTTGLDMWQAKLWYARAVALPAPLATWAAGVATGKAPLSYALPLLAECLFLWWLVSSIIGALSFEMPTRPGLAMIVMATAGMAAGAFAAMLWPVGLLIYGQAMDSLTDRGRQMARYYLMMGDD